MISKRRVPKMVKTMMIFVIMFVIVAAYAPQRKITANNYKDTLYEFWNYNSSIVAYPCRTSPFREKTDDSSAYAYNDKSDQGLGAVNVMGSNNENGSGCENMTAGTYKDLPLGEAYYFPNYVYERGYKYAGFDFYPLQKTFYLHIW